MSELATKSTYDTFPPNANDWDVSASSMLKNETGDDHERVKHVTAELGGVAVDDALSLVSSGSLEPSWYLRAASSDYSTSKGNTGGRGGTIDEVGVQQGLQVSDVLIASPIRGGEPIHLPVAEMDDDERALHGVWVRVASDEIPRADFSLLTPEAKYSVLSSELLRIENDSRSREERAKSTQENLRRSELGVIVKQGEYLHGFDSRLLRNMLNTGLVAGELVGHNNDVDGVFDDPTRGVPAVDAYPFNFDAWDAAAIPGAIGPENKLNLEVMPENYGDVTAVIERSDDETKRQIDPVLPGGDKRIPAGLGGHGHKLIFAGVPSTSVRALQINPIRSAGYEVGSKEYKAHHDKEVADKVSMLSNTLVAEGMYVPIYDDEGALVFTIDEWKSRREANDYSVPDVFVPVSREQREVMVQEAFTEANEALESGTGWDWDDNDGGV